MQPGGGGGNNNNNNQSTIRLPQWLIQTSLKGVLEHVFFAQGEAIIQIFVKLGVQIPIFIRKCLCLLGKLSGQGGA